MSTGEVSFLERFASGIDQSRMWFSKAWRIGTLMAKGAYLIGERKRLFTRLGEQVYYKVLKGELTNAEIEPLVHQLDRLTKKVEIEEMLIRSMRYGERPSRAGRASSQTSN
jgi:hypothetical protein